jgi:serine/threonine-protein kinase
MRAQALATESDARAIGSIVDWPSGETLGTWRAVELLGRGGTAEVWRGVAPGGGAAALKIVRRELRRHRAANALLGRELEALRLVASRHIVHPYELLECDGVAVLVLEYLPHGDLVPLLGTPPRHWLAALRSVVGALRDLERHGLAHGDVKARNVLFAADGSARLADLTSTLPLDAPAAVTTAAYGLPPLSRGCARDADCFALAVLLHELTTGQLPYGPQGAREHGAESPCAVPADPAAAHLLAAARVALNAAGRVEGLSYFAAVIESVRTAYG